MFFGYYIIYYALNDLKAEETDSTVIGCASKCVQDREQNEENLRQDSLLSPNLC